MKLLIIVSALAMTIGTAHASDFGNMLKGAAKNKVAEKTAPAAEANQKALDAKAEVENKLDDAQAQAEDMKEKAEVSKKLLKGFGL